MGSAGLKNTFVKTGFEEILEQKEGTSENLR
jgi:hypothetical protein